MDLNPPCPIISCLCVDYQFVSNLQDVSSSATMIPDTICSGCKDGSRYDKESSSSADPIECTDDFCQKGRNSVLGRV